MPAETIPSKSYLASSNALLDPQFGLIEWMMQEDKITLCRYLVEILAFTTKELVQSHAEWRKLDHPDDVGPVNITRDKVLSGETVYVVYESRKMCRDGNWRWFRIRGKIIDFDETGLPL